METNNNVCQHEGQPRAASRHPDHRIGPRNHTNLHLVFAIPQSSIRTSKQVHFLRYVQVYDSPWI
jgi:hypothetical protein